MTALITVHHIAFARDWGLDLFVLRWHDTPALTCLVEADRFSPPSLGTDASTIETEHSLPPRPTFSLAALDTLRLPNSVCQLQLWVPSTACSTMRRMDHHVTITLTSKSLPPSLRHLDAVFLRLMRASICLCFCVVASLDPSAFPPDLVTITACDRAAPDLLNRSGRVELHRTNISPASLCMPTACGNMHRLASEGLLENAAEAPTECF